MIGWRGIWLVGVGYDRSWGVYDWLAWDMIGLARRIPVIIYKTPKFTDLFSKCPEFGVHFNRSLRVFFFNL